MFPDDQGPTPVAARRASVDFIVPAHNEMTTVGAVVSAIACSYCCRTVTVVADACDDHTAAEALAAGAHAVISIEARDKGTAMAVGLHLAAGSNVGTVGFIDADLDGLRPEHLDMLAGFPGEMAVGLRSASLELVASTPLPPIGGERILPTAVAVAANLCGSGYEAEMRLNLAARKMGVATIKVPMPGVSHCTEASDLSPSKHARLWGGVGRGLLDYLRPV